MSLDISPVLGKRSSDVMGTQENQDEPLSPIQYHLREELVELITKLRSILGLDFYQESNHSDNDVEEFITKGLRLPILKDFSHAEKKKLICAACYPLFLHEPLKMALYHGFQCLTSIIPKEVDYPLVEMALQEFISDKQPKTTRNIIFMTKLEDIKKVVHIKPLIWQILQTSQFPPCTAGTCLRYITTMIPIKLLVYLKESESETDSKLAVYISTTLKIRLNKEDFIKNADLQTQVLREYYEAGVVRREGKLAGWDENLIYSSLFGPPQDLTSYKEALLQIYPVIVAARFEDHFSSVIVRLPLEICKELVALLSTNPLLLDTLEQYKLGIIGNESLNQEIIVIKEYADMVESIEGIFQNTFSEDMQNDLKKENLIKAITLNMDIFQWLEEYRAHMNAAESDNFVGLVFHTLQCWINPETDQKTLISDRKIPEKIPLPRIEYCRKKNMAFLLRGKEKAHHPATKHPSLKKGKPLPVKIQYIREKLANPKCIDESGFLLPNARRDVFMTCHVPKGTLLSEEDIKKGVQAIGSFIRACQYPESIHSLVMQAVTSCRVSIFLFCKFSPKIIDYELLTISLRKLVDSEITKTEFERELRDIKILMKLHQGIWFIYSRSTFYIINKFSPKQLVVELEKKDILSTSRLLRDYAKELRYFKGKNFTTTSFFNVVVAALKKLFNSDEEFILVEDPLPEVKPVVPKERYFSSKLPKEIAFVRKKLGEFGCLDPSRPLKYTVKKKIFLASKTEEELKLLTEEVITRKVKNNRLYRACQFPSSMLGLVEAACAKGLSYGHFIKINPPSVDYSMVSVLLEKFVNEGMTSSDLSNELDDIRSHVKLRKGIFSICDSWEGPDPPACADANGQFPEVNLPYSEAREKWKQMKITFKEETILSQLGNCIPFDQLYNIFKRELKSFTGIYFVNENFKVIIIKILQRKFGSQDHDEMDQDALGDEENLLLPSLPEFEEDINDKSLSYKIQFIRDKMAEPGALDSNGELVEHVRTIIFARFRKNRMTQPLINACYYPDDLHEYMIAASEFGVSIFTFCKIIPITVSYPMVKDSLKKLLSSEITKTEFEEELKANKKRVKDQKRKWQGANFKDRNKKQKNKITSAIALCGSESNSVSGSASTESAGELEIALRIIKEKAVEEEVFKVVEEEEVVEEEVGGEVVEEEVVEEEEVEEEVEGEVVEEEVEGEVGEEMVERGVVEEVVEEGKVILEMIEEQPPESQRSKKLSYRVNYIRKMREDKRNLNPTGKLTKSAKRGLFLHFHPDLEIDDEELGKRVGAMYSFFKACTYPEEMHNLFLQSFQKGLLASTFAKISPRSTDYKVLRKILQDFLDGKILKNELEGRLKNMKILVRIRHGAWKCFSESPFYSTEWTAENILEKISPVLSTDKIMDRFYPEVIKAKSFAFASESFVAFMESALAFLFPPEKKSILPLPDTLWDVTTPLCKNKLEFIRSIVNDPQNKGSDGRVPKEMAINLFLACETTEEQRKTLCKETLAHIIPSYQAFLRAAQYPTTIHAIMLEACEKGLLISTFSTIMDTSCGNYSSISGALSLFVAGTYSKEELELSAVAYPGLLAHSQDPPDEIMKESENEENNTMSPPPRVTGTTTEHAIALQEAIFNICSLALVETEHEIVLDSRNMLDQLNTFIDMEGLLELFSEELQIFCCRTSPSNDPFSDERLTSIVMKALEQWIRFRSGDGTSEEMNIKPTTGFLMQKIRETRERLMENKLSPSSLSWSLSPFEEACRFPESIGTLIDGSCQVGLTEELFESLQPCQIDYSLLSLTLRHYITFRSLWLLKVQIEEIKEVVELREIMWEIYESSHYFLGLQKEFFIDAINPHLSFAFVLEQWSQRKKEGVADAYRKQLVSQLDIVLSSLAPKCTK